jgi:hypothetical protein
MDALHNRTAVLGGFDWGARSYLESASSSLGATLAVSHR